MSDVNAYVLTNDRLAARGAEDQGTYLRVEKARDGIRSVTVQWVDYLDGDTIASAENIVDHTATSAVTVSGTTTSFTISGDGGSIRHKVTTSTGRVRELRIQVQEPESIHRHDYGYRSWL